MSHSCGSTHSLSPRPVRPHRWRLLRHPGSEAYLYLLSLISCRSRPMRRNSYGCSNFRKRAWRSKHFQPKRRKSAVARRCISQFIELGGWEVNIELFRSFICKALILLATTVLMSTAPFALAQEQTESRHVTRAEITENEQ